MKTILRRIDLAATADLETEISQVCNIVYGADFLLISSFVFQNELVLIFQKRN